MAQSKFVFLIVGCLIALFSVVSVSAVAQSPVDSDSFFYQGVLRVDGELLEGTLDVQFHVYDSDDLNLGTDLGFHSIEGVSISNGIVNAKLAFEPGLFDGSSRWLEVWVKEPTAASYTVIEPMIEIVAVPYALAAKTVASVAFDGDSPVNR